LFNESVAASIVVPVMAGGYTVFFPKKQAGRFVGIRRASHILEEDVLGRLQGELAQAIQIYAGADQA
jgi:hypothetical protein